MGGSASAIMGPMGSLSGRGEHSMRQAPPWKEPRLLEGPGGTWRSAPTPCRRLHTWPRSAPPSEAADPLPVHTVLVLEGSFPKSSAWPWAGPSPLGPPLALSHFSTFLWDPSLFLWAPPVPPVVLCEPWAPSWEPASLDHPAPPETRSVTWGAGPGLREYPSQLRGHGCVLGG